MIRLKEKPFYLDEEGCKWVADTLAGMSLQEKVEQLFCEIIWDKGEVQPSKMLEEFHPGAVMFRPFPAKRMREYSLLLQEHSKIPLLIACNLERGGSGGNGGLTDGTYMASPMGIAATDDASYAKKLGLIAGREGAAVGINWTFEPILDIDRNCENPITNVRTYGSNPDRIIQMASAYMEGCMENGMAVTLKHFPGDGADYRDQHLLASVNDLGVEEWMATYGRIYSTLIDRGAQTLMSAHIKQPALTRLIHPDIADEDIMPSSLSEELMKGIIRKKLGFNGLIVTDATQMVGFTSSMERAKAVPLSIERGSDMFLFTINTREDVEYMRKGVEEGLLSMERLEEAVIRILALKASLKLHKKKQEKTLVPPVSALQVIGCKEHQEWAWQCANQCITLVKDKEELFPLTPLRYPHIKLFEITNENCQGHLAETEYFKRLLEKEGFSVSWLLDGRLPGSDCTLEQFQRETDLIIYCANMKVGSNQTTIRLVWDDFLGETAPKYVRDVKTLFLSFSNPYHLMDVPMIRTYVNAYSYHCHTVEAMVEKLMGRSTFTGISPVDPLGGLWDAGC